MRSRTLHSTGFVSFYQNTSKLIAENNLLKRCLDQLWKNVLPTMFILICSSMITLYLSELIYQAKLHSTDLKPAQARHAQPAKTQT
jgi:hypothetical protein